jgi:short-subunit dehydrogenase
MLVGMSSRGTALITGSTSGIGHEFARQLAARGHNLVRVARNRERLEKVAVELVAEYAVEVEVLAADLADRAQLGTVEARLKDSDRPVELLVNNAGFGLRHRFLTNTVDAEQEMHDVLVTAVLRLSHAALGAMTQRGNGGIINVSSVAAFLMRGSYGVAKAWVNTFSEWAASEYRPQGVTVMALCPGRVKTEFHERMGARRRARPAFMWLEPERLVREALQDFDQGKVISIPTKRYKALIAASRVVPKGLSRKMQGVVRRR